MLAPFDYQQECLAVTEAMRRDHAKRALVVMASGLGKTVTVAFDAKSWRQKHTGRFLYLCHQNDILYQAKTTFEGIINQGHTYGYFHGQDKSSHEADFLFASLQTMKRHKESFGPDEFAYIVVDESHHSSAQTYRSTIEYFKPDFLLGVTATPDRLDELNIRDIYGEEVYSLPLDEAIARGLVSPVDYRLLTDEIQLSRYIETGKGRMSISKLNRKIFIPRRDEEIAKIIARHISGLKDPRVIIFCNSVQHCDHLTKFIPNSFAIHSRIPQKERAVRLELFRQGLVGTVLAVDVFNEGIDIPQANVIVFLRSTDSSTVFLQQLGRGLRKNEEKEKVIILDFVANCERIKMVHDLYQSVERAKSGAPKKSRGSKTEPMTLNIKASEFKEKVFPILKLLERVHPNFYPTWQEASQVACQLGVDSRDAYAKLYLKDPRLPSSPRYTYRTDFPGWEVFLGKRKAERYETWQEASKAAIALGIKTPAEYKERYIEDPRLPADPPSYRGGPGWTVFLGGELKNFYHTWEEVAEVCKRHKVQSVGEYWDICDQNKRLPRYPRDVYEDFPGFAKMLGSKRLVEDPYPTWKEASKAAKGLGIKSSVEYMRKYKRDLRLYAAPADRYPDFPGWATFLGIPEREVVQDPYSTWQEAGRAAKTLGIQSSTEYQQRRREDSRLPGVPNRYKGFPGWNKFLGKSR
jgi:superfamily II DNA or RNA helicase